MERRVGIALVAPVPPPFGGMTIQGQALRQNLVSEGFRVVVIETNAPLRLRYLNVVGLRTIVQSVVFLWRLLTVLPKVKVVHVFAASYFYFFARVFPAVVLARLFGRRVIVNYRGGEAYAFFVRFGFLARPVLRLANERTVPSGFLERCFEQQGLSSRVVRNLIDLDRFRFRARDRLQPKLLVTRNLEAMYNIPMALRAFGIIKRACPDARLDLVGDGSQMQALKNWAANANLQDVYFHGSVPHHEIVNFLDRADILLNPTNVDNLPANLLEAFASGLPAVSTNVGGIPDLIGNEPAALLVDADAADAMAEKVLALLNDPGLVKKLTTRARQIAEEFTWSRVREPLFKTYFPMLDQPAAELLRGKQV